MPSTRISRGPPRTSPPSARAWASRPSPVFRFSTAMRARPTSPKPRASCALEPVVGPLYHRFIIHRRRLGRPSIAARPAIDGGPAADPAASAHHHLPELLAQLASGGDLFRRLVPVLLHAGGPARAAGNVARAALRRSGDDSRRLGAACESRAAIPGRNHHPDGLGHQRGVARSRMLPSNRVPAALGSG